MAGGIIALAALAAYHNSFAGPFIFDDSPMIADNATIRGFKSALSPPPDLGVGGRPLFNLTFALNYALGGTNVWGYHAFNLLVHILTGLALFGIVRRTLSGPVLGKRYGTMSLPLALAIAVIWVVHPLQTEAVTYISQRAESLAGLFYLLTLYCFIRSQDSGDRRQEKPSGLPVLCSLGEGGWPLASILSCLLGVLTKEIIVSAPIMVLLYDRSFVSGSFLEAWRRRWPYYLGLAGPWLLLAVSMRSVPQRGVGFDLGVSWFSYALTSCRSIVLYLKLGVWPSPLVLDYGMDVVHNAGEVIPYLAVLVVLLVGTVIALRRWPTLGFVGAWFFVILAPTSSVIPIIGQPMAEHRMYLSLAAVISLVVLGLHQFMGRRSLFLFAILALGLGWFSIKRNEDYRSAVTIWTKTVAQSPHNARALNNLGNSLLDIPGRLPEAIAALEASVRIKPDYAEAHNNLGCALGDMGRLREAMAHFRTAIRIDPNYAAPHENLATALALIPGRWAEAKAEHQTALRLNPWISNTAGTSR